MSIYLIAGGAGFIGSHLADSILKKGHKVIALDNMVTGNEKNVEHLGNNPNFTLIHHDITKPIPSLEKIEGIFHMASPASPLDFTELSVEIMKANSFGTYNLLEFAREQKTWFMMASTSEVYGDPKVHPQREDYLGNVSCTGIRSVYDESKRFSESMTFAYLRKGYVQTSVIRIFNTFGPRMRVDDGRVIPNFSHQALTDQDITIYGDGKQTRSFCYVDDLVEGIRLMEEVRPTEPVNLGNNKERTILEVAQTIVKLTGSKSKIIHKDLPEGDPKRRCPVLDRAKEELNWEPMISFEKGLEKTLEYYKTIF